MEQLELFGRSEIEQNERKLRDSTDENVERGRGEKDELETAVEVWNEAGDPSLAETAEALSRIADDLAATGDARMTEAREMIDETVDAEKTEVSEPAKDAESSDRAMADHLDLGASTAEHFREQLLDGAREGRDGADFLKEIAEQSEGHQQESLAEAERLAIEAKAAADAIKRF